MPNVIPIKVIKGRLYVFVDVYLHDDLLTTALFLVDTGATATFIRPSDERALLEGAAAIGAKDAFSMTQRTAITVLGVGGEVQVSRLSVDGLNLRFRDDQGGTVRIPINPINFAPELVITESKKRGCAVSFFSRGGKHAPSPDSSILTSWSVLGMNVLQEFSIFTFPYMNKQFLVRMEGAEGPDFVKAHLDCPGGLLHGRFDPPRGNRIWTPDTSSDF